MKTTKKTKKPERKKAPAAKKQKTARKPAKKVAARKVTPPPPPAENPRAKQLSRRAADLLLDKKALEVVVLDVRGMTSYADYFVIASGESERQVSAMAEHVRTTLKGEGSTLVGSEGEQTGHWVLLDYGEVVVHLFYAEVRAFYDLEGLWADAPREQVA